MSFLACFKSGSADSRLASDHAMTGETAEELLKELLLGETKTGEELQKVFAASYVAKL